jgi:hypothetical protein
MEQFSKNRISLQINNKFNIIRRNFIQASNNYSSTNLKKYKTFSLFIKRPNLKRITKITNHKENLKNQLDQIGKEDSIFNNDKLITNIRLETLDDIAVSELLEETMRKEKDKNKNNNKNGNNNKNNRKNNEMKSYLSPKKGDKRCLTPLTTKTSVKRNKKNFYNKREDINISNLSVELNCNKMTPNKMTSNKTNNFKHRKKASTKTNEKNLNLFINKPQNRLRKYGNIPLTPIATKNKRTKKTNSNSTLINLNDSIDKSNDSICLTSLSKIMNKTYNKGKSASVNKKLTTMHFPNKTSIKNKDKLLIELQKLFTDKIQLYDDSYQKMTDLDKKNCIVFLLDAIKEMFNINKMTENKNEDIKERNKTKEKQIQDDKNQIKELKKDIIKLNKIIKTNITMNRKLNQKIVNLKTQLEKEKNKNNKNNKNSSQIKSIITKRGITNEKALINKNKVKQRNNSLINVDNKKKFLNRSMDKMKNNTNLNNNKNILNNENRETETNEKKLFKNKNKELLNKEENELSDLIKEKKGIGNNSDCTNFSDANNGIVE